MESAPKSEAGELNSIGQAPPGGRLAVSDLKTMFDGFPDAIFLADLETGTLVDVNPAGERLINRPRHEIIGMHQSQLHPPLMSQTARELFAKDARKVAMGEAVEFQVLRSDGAIVPVEIAGHIISAGGRDVLMGVFRDITSRIEIRERLAANLSLIEAINQAQTSYITGQGVEAVFYQLLQVMRAVATSEFGVIMELVAGEDGGPARLECLAITEVPAHGTSAVNGPSFTDFSHLVCAPVTESRVVIENHLDGRVSYCDSPGCCVFMDNYMGLPIRQGDQTIGLIGFANRPGGFNPQVAHSLEPVLSTLANIIIGGRVRRQRRRAQAETIRAKEEAEEATRLKDKFVSIIAHDLRSPFTSILGFLRLLQRDAAGQLGERQMSTISSAIHSSEYMMEMIDGLLDISRLKTGKVQVRPRFADMRHIGAIAAMSVSVLAEEKGVRIVNLAPEGQRLFADPALYGAVVQNLLTNAIKFSSEGGEVVIFHPEGLDMALAVKDSGVGVRQDFAPDLFYHEVKTTSPGTRGEQGTGLGLPYSADIMKAHGGSVWFKSAPGEGSVFYTMLPRVRPRVVIIDDNPGIRSFARIYLEELGAVVIEAGDGREGMEAIARANPHLVVTDIYMPGENGLDLVARLKSSMATNHLPVIVVTSDSSIEARERALRAGADDFTTKPLVANEFIPRVRRFIG